MNDHELDQRIRAAFEAAVSPEPSAERLAQLEDFWRSHSRNERRRRAWPAAALVASLLAVASLAVWLMQGRGVKPQDRQIAIEQAAPAVPREPVSPRLAASLGETRPRGPSAGRPATEYERLLFAMHTGRAVEAKAARSSIAERQAQRQAHYRRLLAADTEPALREYLSLAADAATAAEALAAADAADEPPVAALLRLLDDNEKQTRLSAAVVLGRINGPEVTAALIRLVTRERRAPTEAWVALIACRDESANRFLAAAAEHPRMLGHVNNARLMWTRMIQ